MQGIKKYWDIIIGIIICIYVIAINLISSTLIAFSGAVFIIGIVLIIYHLVKEKLKYFKHYKSVIKVCKTLIIIGLIFFISIEMVIIVYPKKSHNNSDYLLVLGAGLIKGDKVSLTLKGRLDAAIECINEDGNESIIVVSGGKGNDEKISEAEAMKRYLIKNGVSSNKILMEDKSVNTSENFKFSKDIIERYSGKSIEEVSVKVVTTDFHSFRSSIIAKRNGYKEIEFYSSRSVMYLIPIFYVREAVAVVKTVIFD